MEVLLELVFEIVGEIVMQLVFDTLVEAGARVVRRSAQPSARAHPVLSGLGLLLLGAFAGVVSVWIIPDRILPRTSLSGISLIVSPLCSGLVMQRYGRWRASRGLWSSAVATFAGGAVFAFALAAVRFAMLTQRL